MKHEKDTRHDHDGIINRDGITQGSGYGDLFHKTHDATGAPKAEDNDRTKLGKEHDDEAPRRLDVDKPQS